jgi:hypothetical protein
MKANGNAQVERLIAAAKTPGTRSKRIAETVRLAEDNLRANQWRSKDIKP